MEPPPALEAVGEKAEDAAADTSALAFDGDAVGVAKTSAACPALTEGGGGCV